MIRILAKPGQGTLGRILIGETADISHIEGVIRRMGFRPATHAEIKPEDAEDTPHILVAIGGKVPHPETSKPSFKGFTKKGEAVHILAELGALQPNIEVAVLDAA